MTEIVFRGANDQALTNSLLVAKSFGKEHKHVLDSIRKLVEGCAEISADPMFEETTYVNEQNGQSYPMYLINRDGFSLLVMGFTGKKAMQFKLDYIKAFNQMEEVIKESIKPKNRAEMLLEQCKLMVEQERRLSSVEHRLDTMDKEREENRRLLLEAETSKNKVPSITMRNNIRKLVNQYSKATNTDQQDVWYKIYDNLYYIYSISINSYKKNKRQTKLDVAEKHGFLSKIFDIISDMVNSKR